MILKVRSEIDKINRGYYAVVFGGKTKFIDKASPEVCFECAPAAVHYLEIRHLTQGRMTPLKWVWFILKEIFYSVFFFLVLDQEHWSQRAVAYYTTKKITFNPAPKEETVFEIRLKNEAFDRRTKKLYHPDILLRSNCAVLKQETSYTPNTGDISLCFIGSVIKYAFPAALATVFLIWGIVCSALSSSSGWLIVFSCVQAVVPALGVPYLYRNIKIKKQMLAEIKNR